LKGIVLEYSQRKADEKDMRVGILSFGFKHGLPLEADLVADVRFIPNPYFVPELKNLDGKDMRVREFVMKWPEAQVFLDKYLSLLEYLIPLYRKKGKSCLTIAIGCTGGRHRSVTIAEKIFEHLNTNAREITIAHRDIGKK